MEVINPGNIPEDQIVHQETKVSEKKQDSEFVKGVQKAVSDATKEVEASGNDEPAKMPDTVDVDKSIGDNPVASAADSAQSASANISNYRNVGNRTVKVTQEQKDAFIDCLVSGDRYRESFTRFGGKLLVTVRSRTSDETSAILSYLRRKTLRNDSIDIYSTYVRRAIVAAQVEEVNGVKYDVLKKPYYFVETPEGLTVPGWEEQMDMWGEKPEQVFSTCADCVIEFEARYWHMMSHASDENFWKPGESTGE